MGISISFTIIYLFGGLTFLPIVFLLVLLHAYFTFPIRPFPSSSGRSSPDALEDPQDDGQNLKSTSNSSTLAEKFHRRHEPDVASGYFAVCREYVPGGINGKPPERTTPAGAVVATESPSVYQSMYRSLFDRRQGPSLDPGRSNGKTVKRARNVFFVVLRHGHLMLYEDSEQNEVKHVISLELHDVGIYGGEEMIPEGELWIKRNAIRLQRKVDIGDSAPTSKPFFFFSDNCLEKEDFYFAILQNQDLKLDVAHNPPRPQHFETKHIINLVQRLHSSEEQLQTRWINGLVGRLFLALYKSRIMEDFVRTKITKKIARVKKPAFLSNIVLQNIDMGDSAPHITNPRLKDLTIDGDCCAEADFQYGGNFRLEIAATARIDLGVRFKAREVNLVLAVVVKKLNGHVLVKFKPPPSNRIWISFEKMPDMEMSIEPIVSSRQITYGIILRAIESRIREVMAETIVLPHWDDSPFMDTSNQEFRGGIWTNESSAPGSQQEHTQIPDEATEDEAGAEAQIEVEAVPIADTSPRAKDERIMSTPVLADAPSPKVFSISSADSTQATSGLAEEGIPSSSPKHNDPPKALRSRSFASAANPLLSMDNANVESNRGEQRNKQQKDAASTIKAISTRSRPTSPSDIPNGSTAETTTLWENSKLMGSKTSSLSDTTGHNGNTLEVSASDGADPSLIHSTPTEASSQSMKSFSGGDEAKSKASQRSGYDGVINNTPERKPSMATLGAATAAAKTWGWGVLNRNTNQKIHSSASQQRAGTPSQPMGRGQPLPPPGQPLPFPEGARSKASIATVSKRKPVATVASSLKKQDELKARPDSPPPLPVRKRQGSKQLESTSDEGLLVVQAPPESEPSSPESNAAVFEQSEDTHTSETLDMPRQESSGLLDKTSSRSEFPRSGRFQDLNEVDESTLSSWDIAQEEEERTKSIWPGTEG
ncbi:hypothetical protein ACLMJK_009010 [Lecanora helva]